MTRKEFWPKPGPRNRCQWCQRGYVQIPWWQEGDHTIQLICEECCGTGYKLGSKEWLARTCWRYTKELVVFARVLAQDALHDYAKRSRR